MGIQGLLPLLKDIQSKTSIINFKGQTVGIDAYCWLHKGTYGCAKDLVLGKPTTVYIHYVIRRVKMLINNGVTPILVFDGGYLPAKGGKEKERRERRKDYRTRGLAALREGKNQEAVEHFQKCCDVTPEMASNVIQECYSLNVRCIVSPYEADAQLAYLMKEGITQLTISEDSDLLLYGCHRVLYKMSVDGDGMLVDLSNLSKVKTVQLSSFTFEKFCQMCMLSGCDYLPSIKGMGLVKAHKSIKRHSDAYQCIKFLKCDPAYTVPSDYEENFRKAEFVFKYQLVFDPRSKTAVRLNDLDETINYTDEYLKYAGPKISDSRAFQIALGNLDPIGGKNMTNYTDFASGVIQMKPAKSSSWLSTTTHHKKPVKSTISQKSQERIKMTDVKDNNSESSSQIHPATSPVIQASKSLKRLRSEDATVVTREDKLQKLYEEEEKPSLCHQEISPKHRHHSVFNNKSLHKFKNPFRQANASDSPKSVVISRYFGGNSSTKNKVINANQVSNNSPCIIEPLAFVPEERVKSKETLPELNCSFIEYLDNTDVCMSASKKRLTLHSPKKLPIQRKIQSLCSPKKRKRACVKASTEDEDELEANDAYTVSPSENVDFDITESNEADLVELQSVPEEKPCLIKTVEVCKSKIKLGLSKNNHNVNSQDAKSKSYILDRLNAFKCEPVKSIVNIEGEKTDYLSGDCLQNTVAKSRDTNIKDTLPCLPNISLSIKEENIQKQQDSTSKFSRCKPIGLSKRYKSLTGKSKLNDNLKQSKLNFNKFEFKRKSILRPDSDVVCLS